MTWAPLDVLEQQSSLCADFGALHIIESFYLSEPRYECVQDWSWMCNKTPNRPTSAWLHYFALIIPSSASPI